MIKPIISNRLEDKSIFIHCDCGNEIIQFYYYKETSLCPEIIGLQYYGYIKDKEDSKCTSHQFNRKTFRIFLDKLHESLREDKLHHISEDYHQYLILDKDEHNFWKIVKARSARQIFHKNYVWDICLREPSVRELITELDCMWNIISED